MQNVLSRLVVAVVLVVNSTCSPETPKEQVLLESYQYVKFESDIFNNKKRIEQEKSSKSCCKMLKAGDKLVKKRNVGLYMSPPENAVVYCVDEKSQIQALDRT